MMMSFFLSAVPDEQLRLGSGGWTQILRSARLARGLSDRPERLVPSMSVYLASMFAHCTEAPSFGYV